ncbi:ArsR/SmtB family transcription factor [Megasphaera vaginalis (ex Srinivasan et al. 2021)]|uniref:Putative transcriptional repressor PagR n=1 Tax=Megasphaera vaginalis (ex Srinivasan et al. 2021) TaxID=1111454 RepID=U7UAV4_9FIRM|nr:metalloregulator ArsR/SmtB family transcription factor [Megasphaera vaginalis (ex Srinivasan et al. 2021)]ERT56475.1 putative transcriptional repressor PagR [Megasphaera vaginalis (ex Srinivasan et al. 2021)]
MMEMKNQAMVKETAELLKVIAHPVRLCIVHGLWRNGRCNVSHMQSCLQEPQSTISQHLQKLRLAGIVTAERHGVEITYALADPVIKQVLSILFQGEAPKKGDD